MPSSSETGKTWTHTLYEEYDYSTFSSLFRQFLGTIEKLDIKQSNIKGNIAVIGQGQAFPERALLCEGKLLNKLRSNINLLVTIDSEFSTSPDPWLNRASSLRPNSEKLSRLPHGSIAYYPYGAKYVMETNPGLQNDTFDTIMAFQIANLGQQLSEGLTESIIRVLRPNGVFIGTGGILDGYYENLSSNLGIHLRQLVDLPNPGYSGYPFNQHVGIIFQKSP